MKLTPEQLDRLEHQANVQAGQPLGTLVAVTPMELIELVKGYRIVAPKPPALHQDDGA